MRKSNRIAKFDGLEPRRCEDLQGIVAHEIGPKTFRTFEKQAIGPANIARHRCLRQRKENTIKEELVTPEHAVSLHDRDTFYGLVSLILQKK